MQINIAFSYATYYFFLITKFTIGKFVVLRDSYVLYEFASPTAFRSI